MNLAPVIIFTYNRLEHTKKTIESISKNRLAEETIFYIFQDGSRKNEHVESYEAITEYCKALNFGKEIHFIRRERNFGLFKSVITGVTEVINKHKRVIVLEDDLVTSPSFLEYMNSNLNYFENDDKVGSINGYSFDMELDLPPYYFLKGANPYGWATWEDRWGLLETDVVKLKNSLLKNNLIKEWDYGNGLSMLEAQGKGEISSWLICWHTSLFIKGKLTLFPSVSYVINVGFDGTGVHCDVDDNFNKKQYSIDALNCTEGKEFVQNLEVKEIVSIRRKIQHFYFSLNKIPFTSREKMVHLYFTMKHFIKIKIMNR